jgi:hypothetical protein
MEEIQQDRAVMMSENARMRHNLSGRQKQNILNEALFPDLRDESYELHWETRDREEAAGRQAIGKCNRET